MHTLTHKKLNLLMFIVLAGSLAFTGQARPAAAANLDRQPINIPLAGTANPSIYLPMLFNGYTFGMTGMVTGVVIDATTAALQAGANVCVVGVHCVLSQADGSFYLSDIPTSSPQALNVTPASKFYANYTQTIQTSSAAPLYLVISLSPANLPAGWMRIVLSWQVEGDLDANLWVGSTRIYYNNKGDCAVNACLQYDSKQFGPETMMVKRGLADTLSFAVARNGDLEITQYHALVQLYDTNGLVISFIAPTSGFGSWWYVFDLTWDTTSNPANPRYAITTRNEILSHPPK